MAETECTKVCRTCGEQKAEAAFKKGHARCRGCYSAARKVNDFKPERREKVLAWRARNAETLRLKQIAKRAAPGAKERQREMNRAWQEKNRDYVSAKAWLYRFDEGVRRRMAETNSRLGPAIMAKRRATLKNACPAWADIEAIKAMYAGVRRLSRRLNRVFHVDHIVPLTHPLVCGLHLPANLQALEKTLNHSKGNHWWPDMPDER